VIREQDYPAFYIAADTQSKEKQKTFFRLSAVRLTLLVIAAAGGAFSWRLDGFDVAGIAAAVSFVGAGIAELSLRKTEPERFWYAGRAAAESAKTLAWRYMVGGNPFPVSIPLDVANKLLTDRLKGVRRELTAERLNVPAGTGHAISERMMEVRNWSRERRIELYRCNRIEDQQTWYSNKSNHNRTISQRWSTLLISIELLGVLGGVLKATSLLDFDAIGIAAATVAGFTSWSQAKQHSTLAASYALASHELADIASQITSVDSEEDWANFVDQGEEAISREHTMWRASHS
jgi:hypothetical protein